MTRPIWKNPFSERYLFKNIFLNKINKKREPILVKSRSCFIFPSFVGFVFSVYDGRKFIYIEIFENMVGHRFGEFVTTRKKVIHKKKTK